MRAAVSLSPASSARFACTPSQARSGRRQPCAEAISTAWVMPAGLIPPVLNCTPNPTRRDSASSLAARCARPDRYSAYPVSSPRASLRRASNAGQSSANREAAARRHTRRALARAARGASRQLDLGAAREWPPAIDLVDQAADLAQAGVDLRAQRRKVRGCGLGVRSHLLRIGKHLICLLQGLAQIAK